MDQLYFLFQGWLGNVFRGTGKGRISWWWGFLNLRGLPREVCCWLWKQPSSPSTQEESFLEHPCSPRACPEGTPWHGGGGGGRRCSIWVEIIPRRHFKAFPSFLKVHSIPTLRITMKCWTFSRPFLSWVSVALLDKILARWWESAPLPHSVWARVMQRYWTLLCQIFLWNKQKSYFASPFLFAKGASSSLSLYRKETTLPFCESYFLSPQIVLCKWGGCFYAQEKWGTLLFISWIPGSLFFLRLSH